MTLGVGQFCTKPGLLFVPSTSDGDQLVATLVGELGTLSTMTMLSSGIAAHFRSGVSDLHGVSGVRHLVSSDDGTGAHVGAHLFEVSDALFRDPSAHRLHEECFGPVALIVRYGNSAALGLRAGGGGAVVDLQRFSRIQRPGPLVAPRASPSPARGGSSSMDIPPVSG